MIQPDQKPLEEAYQLVQEGLWDRLKARGSQAVAAVKGAGHQIAGSAKQAAGSVLNKAAAGVGKVVGHDLSGSKWGQKAQSLQKAGTSQKEGASRMSQEAKYRSYINSAVQNVVTDLEKLQMPIADKDQLVAELRQVLFKNLKQVTANGRFRTAKGRIGGKVT